MLVATLNPPPPPPLLALRGDCLLAVCIAVHSCLQIHYLGRLYVAHLLVYPLNFVSSPQEGFAVEVQRRKGLRDALVVTSGWKAI